MFLTIDELQSEVNIKRLGITLCFGQKKGQLARN